MNPLAPMAALMTTTALILQTARLFRPANGLAAILNLVEGRP